MNIRKQIFNVSYVKLNLNHDSSFLPYYTLNQINAVYNLSPILKIGEQLEIMVDYYTAIHISRTH